MGIPNNAKAAEFALGFEEAAKTMMQAADRIEQLLDEASLASARDFDQAAQLGRMHRGTLDAELRQNAKAA